MTVVPGRIRPALLLALAVILVGAAWPLRDVEAAGVDVTRVTLAEAPAGSQLTVVASGPVHADPVALNPRWIALDLRTASLAARDVPHPAETGLIQGVRLSQHAPGVVRVIVVLRRPAAYRINSSADGSTVVVGIATPDAAAGSPDYAQSQATPATHPVPTIDLKVRDQEIVDVLSALAKLAHANIVTDSSVHGRITVQLTGVTLEQALALILEPNGLGYMTVGNTILVGRRDALPPQLRRYQLANITARDFVANILPVTGIRREQVSVDDANNAIFVNAPVDQQARVVALLAQVDLPSELAITRVLRLNYVDAPVFLDLLGARLPDSVVKTAKVDRAGNRVVLTATAAQMQIVDALLAAVDVAGPQVLIEASVVEVPSEVVTNLGVTWQTATTFTITYAGQSPNGQISVSVSTPNITAVLNTLLQQNKAHLLANPRIAVRDGQPARLQIGDKIPFQLINAQGVASLEILDTGVQLEVTPRVNADGYVTIRMHPEVSAIASAASAGVPPTISTREADTTLTVKNGTAIVLAGLIQQNETHTTIKIPLLGDIPLIGWLFKSESTDKLKTEIVFTITPHIVGTGG